MTDSTPGGTGHCLCGAVQYRYEGDPITIGLCQCDRCQRQSGSAFLIGVIFPRDAVTITGPLATYEACIDGTRRLWRHFCQICGSAISITLDRYPGIRSMMGGTLDDKTKIKPRFNVWCSLHNLGSKCPTALRVSRITRTAPLAASASTAITTCSVSSATRFFITGLRNITLKPHRRAAPALVPPPLRCRGHGGLARCTGRASRRPAARPPQCEYSLGRKRGHRKGGLFTDGEQKRCAIGRAE